MTDAPIVFLDTETTGLARLGPDAAEIWDIAAKRIDPDGTTSVWQAYVRHDLDKAKQLPDVFRADHDARYRDAIALGPDGLALWVADVFAVPAGTPYRLKPHVIGAVPDFDLTILERTLDVHGNDVPWHHHITDVETLALGYLRGYDDAMRHCGQRSRPDLLPSGPPWDSDAISTALGINPDHYARHTALGDVLWAEAIHAKVTGR